MKTAITLWIIATALIFVSAFHHDDMPLFLAINAAALTLHGVVACRIYRTLKALG